MSDKPVPPAVAEFTLQERAQMLATIALYETTAENCDVLRARLARYEDADGNPLAVGGVVLPERREVSPQYPYLSSEDVEWNACLDEVARLNSSPVSAGDDAQYPPCDYCAEPLSYHPWHGSGLINGVESRHIHACDKCRHLLPTVSAGEYGDAYQCAREDLAIWKRRALEAETKVREQDQIIENLGNALNDENGPTFMGEPVLKARPALSAPSHGEQVRVPECVRAWFEAKQAHVKAVDDYNARLAFVKQHMPFGTSVDPEYQIMEAADRTVRNLVWPMFLGLKEIATALSPAPACAECGKPDQCFDCAVAEVPVQAEPASADVVPVPREFSDAARDVLAERQRQISAEGWTPEHDDAHGDGALAKAAACYAASADDVSPSVPKTWPWQARFWKPGSTRRMLVKAGALILAEIERIDRALMNGGRP